MHKEGVHKDAEAFDAKRPSKDHSYSVDSGPASIDEAVTESIQDTGKDEARISGACMRTSAALRFACNTSTTHNTSPRSRQLR